MSSERCSSRSVTALLAPASRAIYDCEYKWLMVNVTIRVFPNRRKCGQNDVRTIRSISRASCNKINIVDNIFIFCPSLCACVSILCRSRLFVPTVSCAERFVCDIWWTCAFLFLRHLVTPRRTTLCFHVIDAFFAHTSGKARSVCVHLLEFRY